MNIPRADPHHPDLRVGDAGVKSITCRHLVRVDLVRSTFDVDGYKLALVGWLETGLDLGGVDGIAAPGEFIFWVAAFRCGHGFLRFSRLAQVTMPRDSTRPVNKNGGLK